MPGFDIGALSFKEPLYLWLLAAPAFLLVLWAANLLQRRADARRFMHDRVLPAGTRPSRRGDLAFWLGVCVAAGLCILALARPQARISVIRSASADIVILQDASASMHVKDVAPDRWQRSIRFLRTLGESLSWRGDRVGLALFAFHAAPQIRLTRDPNALFFFLDHLEARSPFPIEEEASWDTNIENGLIWGLKVVSLDEQIFGKTSNPKAFVVISDGQAWSGQVAAARGVTRATGIPVHVVGVGTTAGGIIPDPLRRPAIHAALDRASLAEIARIGGGQYYELGRQPDRDIATAIISSVRRRAPIAQEQDVNEELYWRLLVAAAVTLWISALAIRRRVELWWLSAGAVVALVIVASAMR